MMKLEQKKVFILFKYKKANNQSQLVLNNNNKNNKKIRLNKKSQKARVETSFVAIVVVFCYIKSDTLWP